MKISQTTVKQPRYEIRNALCETIATSRTLHEAKRLSEDGFYKILDTLTITKP